MGLCNGGVWKTDDYGRTWNPIFDSQPTGSIGAIAVAPSDANIIYVASGEGLQRPDLSVGNGIYKSTDAGKTWTHLGLRDGQQIPALVVDPRDANHLFAAVLGHPYGPNEERGVFVSTDGGATWQKALYVDRKHRRVRYRHGPLQSRTCSTPRFGNPARAPGNSATSIRGTHGGIFKSTDGGKTWHKLTNGLPEVVAGLRGHRPQRSAPPLRQPWLTGRTVGIYRSDDAGENWHRATTDARPGDPYRRRRSARAARRSQRSRHAL